LPYPTYKKKGEFNPHKQRMQHVLAWLKMQFMWHGGKKRQAAALEHAIWTCEQFSGSPAALYNRCKCGKIFSERPHERIRYLKIILAAKINCNLRNTFEKCEKW